MKSVIPNQNAPNNCLVDSCTTCCAYHIGHTPNPRAVTKRCGIDVSAYQVRQFQTSDWDRFDYIVVTDSNNQRQISALVSNEQQRQAIIIILAAYLAQKMQMFPILITPIWLLYLPTYQLLETALNRWFDAL